MRRQERGGSRPSATSRPHRRPRGRRLGAGVAAERQHLLPGCVDVGRGDSGGLGRHEVRRAPPGRLDRGQARRRGLRCEGVQYEGRHAGRLERGCRRDRAPEPRLTRSATDGTSTRASAPSAAAVMARRMRRVRRPRSVRPIRAPSCRRTGRHSAAPRPATPAALRPRARRRPPQWGPATAGVPFPGEGATTLRSPR